MTTEGNRELAHLIGNHYPAAVTAPRYLELIAKVDAFFAKATDALGEQMQCHSGCHDCCRARFSVTEVEAAYIREGLSTLDEETRNRMARRATEDSDHCPALEDSGRCAVYAHRPLVCRSHGLPIRMQDRRGLPIVDACFRNFTGGADTVNPTFVLDQTTLSTLLAAVDSDAARREGKPAGARLQMVEILKY